MEMAGRDDCRVRISVAATGQGCSPVREVYRGFCCDRQKIAAGTEVLPIALTKHEWPLEHLARRLGNFALLDSVRGSPRWAAKGNVNVTDRLRHFDQS